MSKPLLHSEADIVRTVLIGLGLGVTPDTRDAGGNLVDWPVSADGELAQPDNAVVVYGTMPQLDGRSMQDGEESYHLAFQVRVRGQTARHAAPKAQAIKVALNEKVDAMIVTLPNDGGSGNTQYLIPNFSKVTAPIRVGREEPSSRRFIFTINGHFVARAL